MKQIVIKEKVNKNETAERGIVGCSVNIIHKEAVVNAKLGLIDEKLTVRIAEFFQVFSDVTRVKILSSLKAGELCVCDIMAVLNLKQSTVSQQLRVLRQMHLVKARQEGKQVYYSLDDDHIYEILSLGIEHLREDKI